MSKGKRVRDEVPEKILKRHNEIRRRYEEMLARERAENPERLKYLSKTYFVDMICRKYKHNGIFCVKYQNKAGKQKEEYFYKGGYKRQKPSKDNKMDILPKFIMHTSTTSLMDRLKAEKCELCGAKGHLEMHHVRKLKNLQNKEPWERHMIARKRKTIALCGTCHKKIHYGTI